MNYLYLLLNLGSISIPFIFSFHPKLRFYKFWKSLLFALVITMTVFISWDIIFTQIGIWGFNQDYFLGFQIANLPIEEWLFFICIPYACVFTHYALLKYMPYLKLSERLAKIIVVLLILTLVTTALIHLDKWYTSINFLFASALIVLVQFNNKNLFRTYFWTFLVMLLPFFIVNGILTGSYIESEVVWYNNAETLGIRLATIPIEDTVYAFSLILMNLFLNEFFQVLIDKKKHRINS